MQIFSYCIMSNHFYILLKVPPVPDSLMSDEDFYAKLNVIYSSF